MRKVKLTKAWGPLAAGAVVVVDDARAAKLIGDKMAVDAEKARKSKEG